MKFSFAKYAAKFMAVYVALLSNQVEAQTLAPASERFKACMSCHGEMGRSTMALTPSLAGQPSFYAITQLFLFREGRRSNPVMTAIAKNMSDDDMRAFSELIEKLPPVTQPTHAESNALDAQRMRKGAALVQKNLCASCHGSDFAGGKQVARLANQREDYLLQTLTEFKLGKRLGYTSAMNESLTGISPESLADVAYYLSNFTK